MIDYHLHTARCCHARGEPEQYLARAHEIGLAEIGFADHFPLEALGHRSRVPVSMASSELPQYLAEVRALQGSLPGLRVLLGIEVDYIPGLEEKTARLLDEHPFDFIIGSIHFLGSWDFTHPDYANDYGQRDLDTLYREYFALVEKACRSGLFDVIGHLDVVKKFGFTPPGDLEPLRRQTARMLRETGMVVELNTAGRDAPVGEFYPSRPLLEHCFREGVPVTLGSDAHAPEQVGRYYSEALELLRTVGYRSLTVFRCRRREEVPL